MILNSGNIKKKLVFILPSLSGGGAEKVMLNLAKNFDQTLFDVTLAVVINKGRYKKMVPDNVRVVYLNCSRLRFSVFTVFRFIRSTKPDYIFSTLGQFNLLVACLIPFLFVKTKFIARESNTVSQRNEDSLCPNFLNFLYRRFYARFDLIICQSTYMKIDFIENYLLPENKLVVINNPIDVEQIEYVLGGKIKKPSSSGGYKLLAVGRAVKQKGFDMLLDVMASLDDRYFLTILGEGPLIEDLKKKALELNINKRVRFEGFVGNPYEYMIDSDIFILTSRYEGFPNVVLEANAVGLPVIAFDCPGGVAEIIISGVNGELVPNADIKEMTKRIKGFSYKNYDPMKIKNSVQQRYSNDSILALYQESILFLE